MVPFPCPSVWRTGGNEEGKSWENEGTTYESGANDLYDGFIVMRVADICRDLS